MIKERRNLKESSKQRAEKERKYAVRQEIKKLRHRGIQIFMAIQIWIRCPICGSKTRDRISEDDLIALLKRKFVNKIEIVRSGSAAVESVSIFER